MELRRATREEKIFKNQCVQRFLSTFPRGFADKKYNKDQREFKWNAHEQWQEALNQGEFKRLMTNKEYLDVALKALSVVSKTHLLTDNETKALNAAIKNTDGAKVFAKALYQLLFGTTTLKQRFSVWCEAFDELPGVKAIESVPRNKKGIISWPMLTVFGFLAQPEVHAVLIPEETLNAAANYGYKINLTTKPSWKVYEDFLEFCEEVKNDLENLRPKDMIDIQSFISLGAAEV
ncbi:MAG: hypothetical protein WC635_11315 [Bacteriovorax sp.]|jgi:hypothetical protein